MNRKIGVISSIVNLLAVLGFAVSMLFGFKFGSYLCSMFIAFRYDEGTGKFYPVLNGDEDTANVLVTLPDGSKGWTDGLGNGYIR